MAVPAHHCINTAFGVLFNALDHHLALLRRDFASTSTACPYKLLVALIAFFCSIKQATTPNFSTVGTLPTSLRFEQKYTQREGDYYGSCAQAVTGRAIAHPDALLGTQSLVPGLVLAALRCRLTDSLVASILIRFRGEEV